MKDDYGILKLRVLLYFLNNGKEDCSVVKISKVLDVTKQRVSRVLIDLEENGYADRTDQRHPVLTESGTEYAKNYAERIRVSLNHLLYEGVPLQQAEEDAYRWAIDNTEATMKVIREAETKCRVKYELRNREHFSGKELCKAFGDGDFEFNFIVYRAEQKNGSNLSMANKGFEHPGHLIIKNGVGKIRLRAVELEAKSPVTKIKMKGKVDGLKYHYNGDFCQADISNDIITFPADAMEFVNIGEGINQIVHGSVGIKVRCTVFPMHMPESEAIFTMIF